VATGVDPTGRFVIGTADGERAIRWTDGQPEILPAGADNAEAVNASGVVVGSVTTGAGSHAWVYRDGQVSQLPVPPGGDADTVSINEAGDIAGTLGGTAPIVWPADKPGTYRVLDAPEASVARAIGDSGIVVGLTKSTGPYQWDRAGSGRPLATLPGLGQGSAVDVAGNWATGLLQWSATEPVPWANRPPGGLAAVRWNLTTGEVTAIGVDALPQAVDAAGQVLIPENPPRLVGLDNVVRPLPPDPGFPRTFAAGMTDDGIVVGTAATDDKDPTGGPHRSVPVRWTC
jgi:probable HAF family extracellular repeat protein